MHVGYSARPIPSYVVYWYVKGAPETQGKEVRTKRGNDCTTRRLPPKSGKNENGHGREKALVCPAVKRSGGSLKRAKEVGKETPGPAIVIPGQGKENKE